MIIVKNKKQNKKKLVLKKVQQSPGCIAEIQFSSVQSLSHVRLFATP